MVTAGKGAEEIAILIPEEEVASGGMVTDPDHHPPDFAIRETRMGVIATSREVDMVEDVSAALEDGRAVPRLLAQPHLDQTPAVAVHLVTVTGPTAVTARTDEDHLQAAETSGRDLDLQQGMRTDLDNIAMTEAGVLDRIIDRVLHLRTDAHPHPREGDTPRHEADPSHVAGDIREVSPHPYLDLLLTLGAVVGVHLGSGAEDLEADEAMLRM